MQTWIRRIEALGPRVALVLMPPSSALWDELPNGAHRKDEVAQIIRRLSAGSRVPLLEPQADLVDEEHYADIAHLNAAGMRTFSAALGEAMAASGLRLPAPRTVGRSRPGR
jgi:hypothetical protein